MSLKIVASHKMMGCPLGQFLFKIQILYKEVDRPGQFKLENAISYQEVAPLEHYLKK
jgi:hypothetical protein